MEGKWKEKGRSSRDSSKHCINTNYPALKTHLYESLIHTTDRAEEVGNTRNTVNFKLEIKVWELCLSQVLPLVFGSFSPTSSQLLLVQPCYEGNGPAVPTGTYITTKETGSPWHTTSIRSRGATRRSNRSNVTYKLYALSEEILEHVVSLEWSLP